MTMTLTTLMLALVLGALATTAAAVDVLPSTNEDTSTRSSSSNSTNRAATSTSNDQWRVFLGLAILVASYVFRVELVRFSLRLVRRALPGAFVWIKEFEKNLLQPLSWVVFILLLWFAVYVMDLSNVLHMDGATITSLITLVLGFPLIWVVIAFCNYITWVRPAHVCVLLGTGRWCRGD